MASTPNWPVMGNGSSGTNVMALQLLLNHKGYNITADGIFGNNTEAAVRAFQGSRGLGADGVAGTNTLSALIVTIANRTNNQAARAAQYLLRKFENLAVDGDFGAGSETATKIFQSRMGITVNGIVNSLTWRFLFGYNAYPTTWYGRNDRLSDTEMETNGRYVYNYLISRGWTKNAICGMLGNMEAESRINPGAWQDYNTTNSGGFGLVQWTACPETNWENPLIRWANDNGLDPTNIDVQLQRITYEEANGLQYDGVIEPYTFSDFKKSTLSAYTLGRAFVLNYERPNNQGESVQEERGSNATKWFNRFA